MLLKITILCMLYNIIYISFFWPIVVIKKGKTLQLSVAITLDSALPSAQL